MKQNIIKISLVFLTGVLSLNAHVYTGEWLNKLQQDGRIDYTPIRFYSTHQEYVKDGIFFEFPADYFISVPHVSISLQLPGVEYNASMVFNALITELTPAGAKIKVTKIGTGFLQNSLAEADDAEVVVYILAYGY